MLVSDLFEAVDRQLVYHGTTLSSAIRILEDGHFLGFSGHVVDGKPLRGLSTSRNPRIAAISNDLSSKDKMSLTFGEKIHDEKLFSVIFVIDLNAARQRNRVLPVDYFKKNAGWNFYRDALKDARSEAEEFIVIPKGRNLPVQNVVTKILYAPYHQRDTGDDESEIEEQQDRLERLAARLRIPFEFDHSSFDFHERGQEWRKTDYLSRVKFPGMVSVSLRYFDMYEKLVDLVKRYEAAGRLSDAEVAALFDADDTRLIKEVWRIATRARKHVDEPISNAYLRVMRNAIKRGSPTEKTVIVAVPAPPKRKTQPPKKIVESEDEPSIQGATELSGIGANDFDFRAPNCINRVVGSMDPSGKTIGISDRHFGELSWHPSLTSASCAIIPHR